MNVLYSVVALVNVMFAMGHPTKTTDLQSENDINTYDFPFVPRSEWQARDPKLTMPLDTPVPYVVIHHSFKPSACTDEDQCKEAMRAMQNMHMDTNGWWDIGYNFAVGSDGSAYEGRGWTIHGAHTLNFNGVSMGICLIGDWSNEVPPAEQLKTAKALIAEGVKLGYIKPDYRLVGHRQVRQTECPGDALFQQIQHWNHYSPFPASVVDLLDMDIIPDKIKANIRGNATVVS